MENLCLTEDSLTAHESPCSCKGSAAYVHHDCMQQWVSQRGAKTCEICKQPYTVTYVCPGATVMSNQTQQQGNSGRFLLANGGDLQRNSYITLTISESGIAVPAVADVGGRNRDGIGGSDNVSPVLITRLLTALLLVSMMSWVVLVCIIRGKGSFTCHCLG